MLKPAFEPCIPTPATKVPAGAEWIHEIKHDGYRLIVQREGKRVRLFTRNGYDWSDRFPLIMQAALRNRISSFQRMAEIGGSTSKIAGNHAQRRGVPVQGSRIRSLGWER
jgi:hypothetical protein